MGAPSGSEQINTEAINALLPCHNRVAYRAIFILQITFSISCHKFNFSSIYFLLLSVLVHFICHLLWRAIEPPLPLAWKCIYYWCPHTATHLRPFVLCIKISLERILPVEIESQANKERKSIPKLTNAKTVLTKWEGMPFSAR